MDDIVGGGQGSQVLVKHVTESFNAMPPGGLCMDCTADGYMSK